MSEHGHSHDDSHVGASDDRQHVWDNPKNDPNISWAKRLAMARPMPLEEPVITIVLSFNCIRAH